jgi:hypothetical protein
MAGLSAFNPHSGLNERHRRPIERILDDRIDDEGGPLVYAMESEELLQRSFDSTCRRLHRFRHQRRYPTLLRLLLPLCLCRGEACCTACAG